MNKKRKLGYWEAVSHYYHENNQGGGLIVAAVPYQGNINIKLMQQATQQLHAACASLRIRIETHNNEIFFVDDVPFADIPFIVLKTAEWQTVVEHEVDNMIPSEKYTWKFIITIDDKNPCLILILHHAIGDGVSCDIFIHQLLSTYSQLAEQQVPTLVSQPLPPPIEVKLKSTSSWQEKELINIRLKKEMELFQKSPWLYEQRVPLSKRSSHFIYDQLDVEKLNKLRAICKTHFVTLHSLINAAAILAQVKLRQANQNILLATPINLRNQCEPPINKEVLGCFVTVVNNLHADLSVAHDIWQLAADYENQLKFRIENFSVNPHNLQVENYKTINQQTVANENAIEFSGGLGISNIGKTLTKANYGNIKVLGFYFGTNRKAGDWSMVIDVATVDNTMYLTFNYTFPNISDQSAQKFRQLFYNELNIYPSDFKALNF